MKIAKYLAGAMLLSLGFVAVSCSDDDDYDVATGNIVSVVETGEAAVTATTVTTQGRVLDLSKHAASSYSVGIVYGTNQDPTTSGKRQVGSIDTETGTVTTTVTELENNVTYYYATFVTLQGKVTRYGDVKQFTTTNAQVAATLATGSLTSVSAHLVGQVSLEPTVINVGSDNLECGFKVAVSADDVQGGRDFPLTVSGQQFEADVDGLLPGKTYYYVSYFKMGDGLVYSDVQHFATPAKEMEYVDMGLSVMWAKWNLGAENETQLGGLYGYGDITGLKTSEYLTQYASGDIAGTDNDLALSISAAIDGENTMKSQLPTEAQLQELFDQTTHEFVEVGGVQGIRFTAKNGNSIFLPAAGSRKGDTVEGEGIQGLYWTGTANVINADYANTLNFTANAATEGLSQRFMGLSIRPVRLPEPVSELAVDNSKVIYGDIEGNGRLRIEIFNLYGAGTASNPPIDVNKLKFSKNMVVTFTLSGIESAVDCYGGLEFAAASWSPSLWSGFDSKYDCHVTGNGTYTVWMETGGADSEGAAVFCIDIDGLHTQLGDAISNVKAEVNTIALDVDDSQMQYYIDNSKVEFVNKDGNGTDGRIEIFNEYGNTKNTGVDVSDLSFSGYQIVTFTISGVDGNLKEGASKSYKTELSYAADGWYPSYWGGTDFAAATITGDGTYTVFAPLDGNTSRGAVVWTIEIYGLWADLVDASSVKVNIDSIVIPGKTK